jgi:hypothetical protein
MVTTAIQALVVSHRERRQPSERGTAHEDALGPVWMEPHALPVRRPQGAGTVPDRAGDAHTANVEQQRGRAERPGGFPVESEQGARAVGELRDVRGMT